MCDIEDFIFVPVVISEKSQFRNQLTNQVAKNADINEFLIELEKIVLDRLFARKLPLYNQKFGGLFKKDNKFGGSGGWYNTSITCKN